MSWRGADADYRGALVEQQKARIDARVSNWSERAAPRGARAARDAIGAAANLEEVTLKKTALELLASDHPDKGNDVWEISRTTYGSGAVEIRGCLGATSIQRQAQSDTDGPKRACSGGSETVRFESSISRSRRMIRSRCMQLNCDVLWTLTKRGKFASVDECWKAFKEFSRLMSLRFGDRWRYVCVPELHADGETYHMHCGIRGFFMVETVRVLWYRALGGKGNEQGEFTPGSINFRPFRYAKRGRPRGAVVRRIAGYIAKYAGKGFNHGNRGRRLFSSSRGLDPDRVERWRVRDWCGLPELVVALQKQFSESGGVEAGDCYFWSRHRSDGSLMMTGFILSTEMRIQ